MQFKRPRTALGLEVVLGFSAKFLSMSENNSNFAVDNIYNMTKKQRADIINAIATTAKKLTPKGSQIILFGSQARGDARDDSDWDVLILLEKPRINLEDIDNVSYPLRELGWEYGEDINTVLYTKKDWDNNSFTPFYKNVIKEGIVL